MAAPDLSVSPEIAAQFGGVPAQPNPLAALTSIAQQVPMAPLVPPPMGDPNVPVGLPPVGVPITQVSPDPVAQQLAAQQALPVIPAPTAPIAPAAVAPRAPGSPDQMAGATTEVRAAGQESTQVGQQGVEVAKQGAEELAKADELRAQAAQESADRLTALQKRQEGAYNESKAAFDQAKQDVSNFKFHDFFADKSFAQQALAGIGMLLGGVSYDANHVNQAVNVVQSAIKRDSDQQLSYLHSKEHLAELAQAGVRDTQSYLAHEMANFQTAEALKKEAVARQIADTLSSTTRGKQNVIAARQVAAGLRESAAKDAQAAILQGTHNRVMQSQIGLNNANAAHARAAAGAAGAAKQSAEELKVASEIDRRLKADPTTTSLVKSQELLNNAKAATASGNSAELYGAIDSFLKEKSGGMARQQAIAQFKDRLGGVGTKFDNLLQGLKDGNLSPAAVKRFSDAIDGSLRYTNGALSKTAAMHERLLLKSPEYARHADLVKAHIADALHQGGEEPAPAAPAVKYVGTRAYKLGADGLYH